MDVEAIKGEIEQTLASKVSQDSKLHNIYLLVHSDARHIHWPMAAGRTDELLANPHQPFHTASVGKTFTSVILAMLIEKGMIRLRNICLQTCLKGCMSIREKTTRTKFSSSIY